MKVKELYTMDFNEACERLAGETDIITTYESLKDYAIHMIQEDHLYLAMHILEAIHRLPPTTTITTTAWGRWRIRLP